VSETPIPTILAEYGLGPEVAPVPIAGGLINRTYEIRGRDGRFVLQWVNPIFDPRMHEDIERVTRHLAAAGMVTPRMVRTRTGALWVPDRVAGVWRLMTYVAGRTLHRATGPELVRAAGELVGEFHRALSTLDLPFAYARLGVHDTKKHFGRLEAALDTRRDHPRYEQVAPLGESILRAAAALSPLPHSPLRVAHGDLKISNLLFEETLPRAVAIVDLDTLSRMPLPVEMGDAFRSWCNPAGEDRPGVFDAGFFEAAVAGYARGAAGMLLAEEIHALVCGTETIAVELAARFCADALEESYFAWDPQRFPSRSEHNRVRALSQMGAAAAIAAQRAVLEATAARAFALA
jgi:Ser/Thr protein kinase RdoA (MazF antagonist)